MSNFDLNMDIDSLLASLGFGSKETVYLSVTPGVGLELLSLDIATRSVKSYASRPLEYNESLREIVDYDAFKDAVLDLFATLKINPKSNVVLNVPTVLFNSKSLPLLLADDAVNEALVSEAEQSYIFKRYDPSIAWSDSITHKSVDQRKLYYSAIQTTSIESITRVLKEIGAKLVGLQISLTSVLKALEFSGRIDDYIVNNQLWNLMIVNQTGYSICSMKGSDLVDYYEEPVPIRTLEGDEIYAALNASIQITMMSYPANYLYVVSVTDLVGAEVLSNNLNIDGEIRCWDSNIFRKQDFIPVSLEILEDVASTISLDAIGVATGNHIKSSLRLDFVSGEDGALDGDSSPVPIVIGDKTIEITPVGARNVSFILAAVLLIPALLLYLVLPGVQKTKAAKLSELKSNLTKVNSEITSLESAKNRVNNFDINSQVGDILKYNRQKMMAYATLGEAIPESVWMTYFVAQDSNKICVKGESKSVEGIYVFYKNMKDYLIDAGLKLQKIEMISNTDEEISVDLTKKVDYGFEISNMAQSSSNENGNEEMMLEDVNSKSSSKSRK
ncbi:MAG: hypothetical protein R3Y28_01380 [Candidatus Gastranaerophilales bacterium]